MVQSLAASRTGSRSANRDNEPPGNSCTRQIKDTFTGKDKRSQPSLPEAGIKRLKRKHGKEAMLSANGSHSKFMASAHTGTDADARLCTRLLSSGRAQES